MVPTRRWAYLGEEMAAMAEEAQREAIILDVDDDDLSSRLKVLGEEEETKNDV